MKKNFLQLFFIFILIIIPNFISAAESTGQTVTITPLMREITVNAGESITGTIDLTNPAEKTQTLYPLVKDFTSSDDPNQSSPKFFEETPADYAAGLAAWVSFDQTSVEIPKLATRSIKYTIKVPTDSSPGGHFGAVFASTEPPASSGNSVAVSGRIGSLILLTVRGEMVSRATIIDTLLTDANGKAKIIFQKLPIISKLTLNNTGNVHLVPSGTITLSNWRNQTVLTLPFNSQEGRILPSSKRVYSESINSKIGYGKFTLTTDIILTAPNGDHFPLNSAITFWFLPLNTIIFSLVILIALTIFFRTWLKRHDTLVRQQPPQK